MVMNPRKAALALPNCILCWALLDNNCMSNGTILLICDAEGGHKDMVQRLQQHGQMKLGRAVIMC